MLAVSCPGCQKNYRLDLKFAGKKVRCKSCEEVFVAEEEPFEAALEDDSPANGPPPRRPKRSSSAEIKKPPARRGEDSDDDEFSSSGGKLNALPALPKKSSKPKKKVEDEAAPKKKTSKKSRGFSPNLGGGILAAVISGSIAGAFGAAVWGAIAYFTHREVGYVAWGIGGLVGISVQAASGDLDEFLSGVIASAVSIGSILAGKFIAVIFLVNWMMGLIAGEEAGAELPYWSMVAGAFGASFGPIDLVFFLLAVFTAYRIASGNSDN